MQRSCEGGWVQQASQSLNIQVSGFRRLGFDYTTLFIPKIVFVWPALLSQNLSSTVFTHVLNLLVVQLTFEGCSVLCPQVDFFTICYLDETILLIYLGAATHRSCIFFFVSSNRWGAQISFLVVPLCPSAFCSAQIRRVFFGDLVLSLPVPVLVLNAHV